MQGQRLAKAQLFDDEVEQLAPFLDVRAGQRQRVRIRTDDTLPTR